VTQDDLLYRYRCGNWTAMGRRSCGGGGEARRAWANATSRCSSYARDTVELLRAVAEGSAAAGARRLAGGDQPAQRLGPGRTFAAWCHGAHWSRWRSVEIVST
jgi:hypothetical protein